MGSKVWKVSRLREELAKLESAGHGNLLVVLDDGDGSTSAFGLHVGLDLQDKPLYVVLDMTAQPGSVEGGQS